MDEIIQVATKELGISEIKGSGDNDRILKYANDIGHTWISDDETPWCSIFMNWVAMKSGYEKSGSGAARSWLNIGFSVENPEPGDIVVYWRESPESHKGHVGIFLGFSNDHSRIYTLGGNQNDSVSISAYSVDQLLGFRRLREEGDFSIPKKILKRGHRGKEVTRLQNALKQAGFDVGTSDGIFGPKTESALKQFQATIFELEITGIFDKKTRESLLEVLNAR